MKRTHTSQHNTTQHSQHRSHQRILWWAKVLNAFGMRVGNLLKASSCVSNENEERNTFHVYC